MSHPNSSSQKKKSNQNYATSLAGGGSVRVKDGVKTYSDKGLKVKGKGGISISGESYSRDKGGTGFAPASAVITPGALGPSSAAVLPPPIKPTGVPDITALNSALKNPITGTNVDSVGGFTVDPITDAAMTSGRTNFEAMMEKLNEAKSDMPSAVSIQRKLDRQTGIDALKNQEAEYTGQIDSIVKNRDANVLKLEGQGRGITDVIIGGQQAQLNKEAAIAALPIQAQLAGVQGKIQVANDYINKWGTLLFQDATNKYNQTTATIKAVYDFGTSQDKLKFDSLQAQATEKKNKDIALASAKTKAMSQALSQPGGASVISAIQLATDENGVVAALGKYNGDLLQQEAQRANIAQSYASIAASDRANRGPAKRDTQVVDGKLIDLQTGEVISDLSPGVKGSVLGNALASQNINNINNILSSKGLSSVVGTSGLSRSAGGGLWGATKRFFSGALAGGATGGAVGLGFGGVGAVPGAAIGALTTGTINALKGSKAELTGDRQNFIGSVEQLRSQLTLDKLVQAKENGATFGALSDGERVTLSAAATKLGTWAMKDGETVTGYDASEAAFKKEMDVINNFAKLDAILKGADPASVGAITKEDNTIWVVNSDGTYTQLK